MVRSRALAPRAEASRRHERGPDPQSWARARFWGDTRSRWVVTHASTAVALTTVLICGCAGVELPRVLTPSAMDCAADVNGRLVADGPTSLGLADVESGLILRVVWPVGYEVRDDGGRLAVRAEGRAVAHESDEVRLRGSAATQGTWRACLVEVLADS